MAEKKCTRCEYVTDDENLSTCPLCNADLEETNENVENAQTDDTVITEAAEISEDTAIDETAVETDEIPEEISEEIPEPKKSKTGLIVAIAALVVLIIAGALYISMSGAKPPKKIIDVETFSKEDVSGLYSSDTQGRYFEFTIKDTEVEIYNPDAEAEEEITSDASASSDAAPEKKAETEIHDGVFYSAFSEEYISKQCAAEYIKMNSLTDDFEAFVKEKKLADDDYGAYIKAKKLEQEVNDFDEQYQYTEYMNGNATNGTWKLEGTKIKLYDETGAPMYDLEATPYGLVNSNTYFKGDVKSGKTMNATLENVAEDVNLGNGTTADIAQSFILYKDGNFILKEVYKGESDETNYAAGTYTVNGNTISIDLQGGINKFTVLKDGICLGLYTK